MPAYLLSSIVHGGLLVSTTLYSIQINFTLLYFKLYINLQLIKFINNSITRYHWWISSTLRKIGNINLSEDVFKLKL